jgi:hypothetical protein
MPFSLDVVTARAALHINIPWVDLKGSKEGLLKFRNYAVHRRVQ